MKNRGFTLVELIIVIVVLGVLAITALPRFLDVSNNARASTIEALQGAIETTVKNVAAKAVIAGKEVGEHTLEVDGITVSVINGAILPKDLSKVMLVDGYTEVDEDFLADQWYSVGFYPNGIEHQTKPEKLGSCVVRYSVTKADSEELQGWWTLAITDKC